MNKPVGLIRGAGAGWGGPVAKRLAREGDPVKNGQAQLGLRLPVEVANACIYLAHQRRYACIYEPNLRAHADLAWLNPASSSGLN